ncbi:MAG: phosphoribosylformylglycinamidine synthase subunit PurS [Chloroflexi bacterium]|nr:phosphoribosylformylglycinamidine synthase subunit PurS [Chloroflexota bacterium]
MSGLPQIYTAHVFVRLKPGVNDPQGATVAAGLRDLDFDGIRDVRVGKIVDVELAAPDAVTARARVEAMCEQLLTNPVIEEFELELIEPQPLKLSDTAW